MENNGNELRITITTAHTRWSNNWQPRSTTWDLLAQELRNPKRTGETVAQYAAMNKDEQGKVKDVGGYVAGEMVGTQRKKGSVKSRCLVTLDADNCTPESLQQLEDNIASKGWAAVVHSTHSSKKEAPRLRIILPIARPVSAGEYESLARGTAAALGSRIPEGTFDGTTYQPERLMYWPSVPKDGEYIYKRFWGAALDPATIAPPVESLSKYTEKARQKQGDPLKKPGLVGAFNRAYTVPEAIEEYLPGLYTEAGGNRLTWAAGSTTGGALLLDDETFLYSYHGTDPAQGQLLNAYDLVRLHKFGELDKGHGGEPWEKLPSQAAMHDLCTTDARVREEAAAAVFSDLGGSIAEAMMHTNAAETLEKMEYSEQGIAVEFAKWAGAVLKHNKSFGWMYWNGKVWELEAGGNADAQAALLVMHYSDFLYGAARIAVQLAASEADRKKAQERLNWLVRNLRTNRGVKGALSYAAALLNEFHPEKYDSNPWELNTPGGIIDLKTGAEKPHTPEASCTKCTAASLSEGNTPEARKMWEDFLEHISGGDAEFIQYLQTLAGMAAVGAVYEEGLVISYGPGGNGKSTFWGALKTVLGDYARTINADVLVATRNGHTDQSYVAALRGARLVLMSETEEGAKFGIAQMKRLTSRDNISARSLYKDPIEFRPTHTTIMHTNHLPQLKSMDGGVQRRIAVAPFPATLPPERTITNYQDRLVEQCSGTILKWIVDGARMFWSNDCKLPTAQCVRQASQEYMVGEDWLGFFLDERCTMQGHCAVSELYTEYKVWAQYQGEYVRSRQDLGKALAGRGLHKQRHYTAEEKGWYWEGIGLLSDEAVPGAMHG